MHTGTHAHMHTCTHHRSREDGRSDLKAQSSKLKAHIDIGHLTWLPSFPCVWIHAFMLHASLKYKRGRNGSGCIQDRGLDRPRGLQA
jgi:hypothetical protein